MDYKLKQAFSIPNILCYFRMLLIPCFVWAYFQARTREDYYLVAAIVVLSGITDFLDGFIARRFNMVTELGKAIDPLADKLTQAALAVCLIIKFPLMWLLITVFMIKELSMGIACYVLYRKGKKLDGALWFGKITTAIFYLTTILLIAVPTISKEVADVFILIDSCLLTFAFVKYMIVFVRMHRE